VDGGVLTTKGYELVDFERIPKLDCPCGTARRGLMSEHSVPYSLHLTDISLNAKTHYHLNTTETYLFLECEQGACMELDGQYVQVHPLTAVVIHPGTRHRAVGRMRVAIIASPKFDPSDEWMD
jgi:mannose-6-phosphate isomerase-like protein (cupin superfamily)